jgi:hypothetical protein
VEVLIVLEFMWHVLEKEHDFEPDASDNLVVDASTKIKSQSNNDMQLSFFQLNDPVLQHIKKDILAIDINTLTPVEALLKLNEIKRALGN